MQTRRQSIIEITTSTFVGMAGSWSIAYLVMSVIDERIMAATITTALCTVWSLFRGYSLRRFFNSRIIHKKGETEL